MSLESFFEEPVIPQRINMLVPWYLMASYRYYEKDDPIVSDRLFDLTAKKILKNWENISHVHKDYLNIDMLEAGTYNGSYPSLAVGACYAVSNKIFEKRLNSLLKNP